MKRISHYLLHIFMAVVFFAILPCITYSKFVNTELHEKMEQRLFQLDSLRAIQVSDTLPADSLPVYYRKIERLFDEMKVLQEHYVSDTNLMIDKTDAWMSYWMGIFAIVMAIPAILFAFQYHLSHKDWMEHYRYLKKAVDDEILASQSCQKELRDELKAMQNIQQKLRDRNDDKLSSWGREYGSKMDELASHIRTTLDDELKRSSDETERELSKLKKAVLGNRMSTIMMCLSSFPDPQMVSEKAEKRSMVSGYLELLYKEFCAYTRILCQQDVQSDDDYVTMLGYVRLVLLSIKLAVIRSQSSFTELNQDIAFHTLVHEIDRESKMMASGIIKQSDLKDELESVQVHFLRVLDYIRA